MIRKILVIILVVCPLAVGCASKQAVSTPKPPKPTIPTATTTTSQSALQKLIFLEPSAAAAAPLIIAEEQGYFKKYGLMVEQTNIEDVTQLTAAIQSGKLDGVGSDIITAINLNAGGTKVAITSKTNDRFMIVSNQSLEKLKTKGAPIKVGMSRKNSIEYIASEYFKSMGINLYDPSQVEIVTIPKPSARLEMINTGDVDVAVLNETLGIVAVDKGAKLLGSSDTLGIQVGCILFTESAIKNKSKEVEDFYKAYNDAISYMAETPTEKYMDAIIAKAKYPIQLKKSIELPNYTKAILPSEDEVSRVNAWMNKVGITDKKLNFSDIIKDVVTK